MADIINIDGVEYRCYPIPDKGKYYGGWTDMDTGETGQSSKVCSSEKEAVEAAKGNATVSHSRRHRKSTEE